MRVVWDYSYTECCGSLYGARERHLGSIKVVIFKIIMQNAPSRNYKTSESQGFILQKAGFSLCECL